MSAGPPIPGQGPLPRLRPTASPTGGSQTCSSGQHLDDRTGQCSQDCRSGFVNFQGDCMKECPPGMTLNDEKLCIRPTFSRAFYVNESSIKSTTVMAVGQSPNGGGQFVLGSYSENEKDIAFQDPVSLNARALTIVPLDKTSYNVSGELSRFLVGEVMNNFAPTDGSSNSCLQVIDVVRDNPTGPSTLTGIENAPVTSLGLVQSNTIDKIDTNDVQNLQRAIDRVVAEGGPGRTIVPKVQTSATGLDFQYVTGPQTILTSESTTSATHTVPSSAAKILPVPNTHRIQVRTEAGSAQNNTIFTLTGTFDTESNNFKFQSEREPALEVQGLLDLVLSGAQALPANVPFATTGATGATGATGSSGEFGLESIGDVINQGTQTPLAPVEASNDFYITTSLDARVFETTNAELQPAGALPTALQVPQQVNPQQNISVDMNEGFILVGQPKVPRSVSQASVSTQYPLIKDGIITENLYKIREIDLKISTNQGNEANALQVTNTQRLPRSIAFDENGKSYTGLSGSKFAAQEVQNSLYIFGRGFSPKNDYNENISDSVGPVLSQTSEYGQNAQNAVGLSTVSPSFATGTNNLPQEGLWAVSNSLVTGFVGPIQAVPVPGSEFCSLGDFFYNAATDSIAMSFTNSSPLSSDVANKIGALGGLGQTKQTVLRFQYTGRPEILKIPANCINVHVILQGAGGSTENGQGGSGAQIEGDLVPSQDASWWRLGYPSQLQIIVGGGGNSDSTFQSQTFGGGGAGSSQIGQGGGRTAIQSLSDITRRQNIWVDRIVAGGGGGSSGEALGGNAGHFVVDLDKQYSQGSAGSPGRNAGQGAYIELSLSNVQTKAFGGQGGITQGLGYTANAQAGSLSIGGSSNGFPAGTSALGSGGGGGGYLGGGGASQLGNVDNELDVPSGGGGGCSFAPTNLLKNLQSAPGQNSIGPKGSNLANALVTDRVAAGGSSDNPLGAPGQAVVILTLSNGTIGSIQDSANPTNDFPLYYSVSGFDPRVKNPFSLVPLNDGDDNFRLVKAEFGQQVDATNVLVGPSIPTNPLTAVFVTNTFILACEWGPLQDNTDPNNVIERFWAAPIGKNGSARVFSPLTTQWAKLFPNLRNVQAIRNVSGDIGTMDVTTVVLLGEGIYIARIFVDTLSNLTIEASEAVSSLDNESFAGKITFNDGNYNGSNGGQFIAAGSPTNVSLTLNMQLNALPQFAKGSQAPDVSNSCWQSRLAGGQNRSNNSASDIYAFQPTTPSQMSKNLKKVQNGFVQDNSVKFGSDGASVAAIGGYLEIAQVAGATGINFGIATGSPYAFTLENTEAGLTSYVADFTTIDSSSSSGNYPKGIPIAYKDLNTQNFTQALVRSPSNILVSPNGANGFDFALSEYSQYSGSLLSGQTKGPLTKYIQLPMDYPHTYTGPNLTAMVYTQFLSDGNTYQQYFDDFSTLNQNLFSRFSDIAQLPSPKNPKEGQYIAGGQFTQDLNLCWLLGGIPLVGTQSGPQIKLNQETITAFGVVPQNLDSNTTLKRPMNGSLWILKTTDIKNNAKPIWKARPLWTTRSDEHFYNVIKIKTLDVDPAIWNNTFDNPNQGTSFPTSEAQQSAFISTNLGLQTVTYDQIDSAYNKEILIVSSPSPIPVGPPDSLQSVYRSVGLTEPPATRIFNPSAFLVAAPAADDMVCKKDQCEVCQSNNYNQVKYRGELGTVEDLCLRKYLSLTSDPTKPVVLDTPEDSQSQVNLLDIVETPSNQAIVGPNIKLQQTQINNGQLFFGNILQGPQSGPDNFNAAIGPGRDIAGPENGISVETGSTGLSQRVRTPIFNFDNQEIYQPWILDPFLGIPTSYGNSAVNIEAWDAYVEARQQLRRLKGFNADRPKAGALRGQEGAANDKFYFGYVDAGKTDQNAFLIQRQIETGSLDVLPTQSPVTYTTAQQPGTIGTDPITKPFRKVGAAAVEPDYFYDAEIGLTFGAQDLYPIVGTTGQQFLPLMNSQFVGLSSDFAEPTNAALAQCDPNVTANLQNQGTLVVDTSNNARVYGNFLDLDLTHFYSTEADVSPNLSSTLGNVNPTDLPNQTEYASRLVCPLSNSSQSVKFLVDDFQTYNRKNMVIPSVTTNFFRARNWAFYWPKNPIADQFVFADGSLMNDQPSLGLSGTSNVTSLQVQMSEFLQPDPFIVNEQGNNWKAQSVAMKDKKTSPSLQPNDAFMYSLGLSQLRFASSETKPQIVYKNVIAQSTTFPVEVANLPIPSSAPGPIAMPDNSIQEPNDVATWIAEDASQVSQSKSPLYSQAHGVYFSNARVDGSAFNAFMSEDQPKEAALVLKVQMDVFVNCTLMAGNESVFDFATPQESQPLWYQSMTQFSLDGTFLKNSWTPLERLVFADPMTHDSTESKNLLFTLRDLDTYIQTTLGIPGIVQLNTPLQNRVWLSSQPLSLTTSKTVPRVINVYNTEGLLVNAYGPFAYANGLKVPVNADNQTKLYTTDAQFAETSSGPYEFAAITTNLNFLRWSQTLNLPILAGPNALEVYRSILPQDTFNQILSNVVVNPILWAPNFDNQQVSLQSKTIEQTSINLTTFDLKPDQKGVPSSPLRQTLEAFYGLNLDQLSTFTEKNRAQALTNARTINQVPKEVSSTVLSESDSFSTDSKLIRCNALPLEVTYQDSKYDFYTRALARNRFFNAVVRFANPYLPQFSPQNFQVDKFQANQLGQYWIGKSNPDVRNPSNQAEWPQWSNILDPVSYLVTGNQLRAMSIRFTNPQSNMNAQKQVNSKQSSWQKQHVGSFEWPYNYGMVFSGQPTNFSTSYIDTPVGVFESFEFSKHKFQLNFAPINALTFQVQKFPQLAAPQLVSVIIPFVNSNIETDWAKYDASGLAVAANSYTHGMINQPMPNNFLCFQAQSGALISTRKGRKTFEDVPFGLQAGPSKCTKPQTFFSDLIPSQGARQPTGNATFLATQDSNFMIPIKINPNDRYGTISNPILIVTNPNMDIYHNGFNGAWTPVSAGGKIPCNPQFQEERLCTYTNDQGQQVTGMCTYTTKNVDPNCQNNQLDQWPQSVQYGSSLTREQGNVAEGTNIEEPCLANGQMQAQNLRPQLAIATVQSHNDKVLIRVSQSGWLNFPNWACYVPSTQQFQGDPRYETGAFYENTPLQNITLPDGISQKDLFQIRGNIRQIKVTDQSVYDTASAFGSRRGNWKGGMVMTNRNQNDFVQTIFGNTQNNNDQQQPPPFGWLLTQFASPAQADVNTLLEGQFPQPYVSTMQVSNQNQMISFLPTASEVAQLSNGSGIQQVINDNSFQVFSNLDSPQTYPEFSVPLVTGAGTRSIWQNNSQIWTSEIVSTCGAQAFVDGLLSGTVPLLPTSTSIQPPTNNSAFSQDTAGSQSQEPQNFETDSYGFRFDCGGVLNVTSNDPLNSEQSQSSGTLGISIQVDITRGDTLCFTQSALQRLVVRSKNVPGVAAQPSTSFDSLPGATDIGQGRLQDNQGLISKFNWTPNVFLANMAVSSPFTNPDAGITPQANQLGYGAPGTMDNDEPYVICCQFSETPDFNTANQLNDKNKIYSTSEFLKNGLVTEAPTSQVSSSACVDVYQVQPPSSYLMDVKAPNAILQAVNTNNALVAPLMCYPDPAQADVQPQSPWIPITTPDWSGLGLSLCKQDSKLYGNFLWSASWIQPSEDPLLETANVPAFSPSSPFLKYFKAFQPVCSRVYTAASGNENQSPVLYLGQIEEGLNTVKVGQNISGNTPQQAAWPIQPNAKTAQANWNQKVNNAPGSGNTRNFLKPGGLASPSLRAFNFSLPTENEMGVTALNYNSYLAERNRLVLGSDTGLIRLYDFKENITLSEVPRGSFVFFVPDGTGSVLAQQVNVSQIFSIVWFQKRWFVATNMGIFWTPIDESIPFLRGQNQDTLNNFVAATLRFVQLPPKAFLKDSKVESIYKENHGFPPCTFLDKRFNGKRSVLIASYPDQAQGQFSPNSLGAPGPLFPQMTDLVSGSAALPLNAGQTFNPTRAGETPTLQFGTNLSLGGTNAGAPEVCQSFEIIFKTNNTGLREFRQSAKFTGLPTVGAQWTTVPAVGIQQPQGVPVMINSQLTDLVILKNRVLQSSMQIPYAAFVPNVSHPAAQSTGQPPNTYLFGLANGGARSFLNATNEILAPVPTRNSFQVDPVLNKLVNWSKPVGNRTTDGNQTQGDQSIRTCQIASVTVTQPLDIAINSNEPVIDFFLFKFQDQFTQGLKNVAGRYEKTAYRADPARQSSLQGILFNKYNQENNLLDTVTIKMAPQVYDAIGIQPAALGIGIKAEPQILNIANTGINQPIIHPTQFSEITMDIYNQAFWGFRSEQCMQYAQIVPASSTSLPFPGPSTITNDFSAKANDCCMWFYALDQAAYFNSSIFQYRVAPQNVVFEPKTYLKDSYLNRTSSEIENNNQEPPLQEQIFESLFVFKANLVFPNDSIGDIAQGPGANSSSNTSGTLSWSLGGPYSATPLQMSERIDATNGQVTQIQSTILQTSNVVLTTGQAGTVQKAFKFGLPSLASNVVMDYNPQTTEFWAAGIGFNVDDKAYLEAAVDTYPDTKVSTEFQAYPKRTPRLMICSNSGQIGTNFNPTVQGGVPTAATDLLPSTLNWTEVLNELPQVTPDGKTSEKKQLTLLSESFKGTKSAKVLGGPAKVNCFGFSPTITAVCGYSTVRTPSVNNSVATKSTSIWYNIKGSRQWNFANFLVPGEVTAITFVGYGWQIAIWYNNQSTLYFASANFTVVAIMDTWGPNQNFIKVNSFASLSLNQIQPCNAAAGFEPNPLNPKICLKKCPEGQTPFDDLCALRCPTEFGFKTTDLPNECVPPRQKPKLLPPQASKTIPNVAPAQEAYGDSELDPIDSISPNPPIANFVKLVIGGLVVVIVIAFLLAWMYQSSKVKPTFADKTLPLKLNPFLDKPSAQVNPFLDA